MTPGKVRVPRTSKASLGRFSLEVLSYVGKLSGIVFLERIGRLCLFTERLADSRLLEADLRREDDRRSRGF